MRRIVVGIALGALLAFVLAVPAGAMPPNEILIARNLQRLGVIPSYATPTMARAAVRALTAKGTRYVTEAPAGTRSAPASLTRYLAPRAGDPSATDTYTTNALVLLVEFGTAPWPDGDSTGHDMNGPEHGNIGAPAADDNFTFWPGDFSTMHYQQMLFGTSYPIYAADGALRGTSGDTMRTYYLEQSHGTYTVSGEIANWVKLDVPESYYGADTVPWAWTDDLTGPIWRVARDAVGAFAAANPGFDWARYDQENPWGIVAGGFHQPDGYIDHLIIIHAGSDESAGGGDQLSDAIWAHSWGIYENESGGPGDGPGMMIPGTEGQGPQGKGIWAFNYTIDPEDGDVGVFCHEFAHDLGLADQYDYSSETGDASSGFWTIMAGGSWLGSEWGGGSKPASMNADDKASLGFVKPKVVKRGTKATVKLQAAATGTANKTAVKIPLPKAKHTIRLSGRDGSDEWYSTPSSDLDVTLRTKSRVAVPAGAELTFRTWYDMEDGYARGSVDVSEDGSTWTNVAEYTGSDRYHWGATRSVDLSAFGGKSVYLRFMYAPDETQKGWEVTGIAVGGRAIRASAFSTDGWVRVDGSYTTRTTRYYIAEYRTYDGFDEGLESCYEWNRYWSSWVDRFSYNRGLHLIYRDTFYNDNDVAGRGGGAGGWMVVDARPLPDGVAYTSGTTDVTGCWRPRIQVRDASFSVKPTRTQSIFFRDYDSLSRLGFSIDLGEQPAPGKLAQPWFKDTRTYWYSQAPEAGVKIPKLGVRIHVTRMTPDLMTIWVDNKK